MAFYYLAGLAANLLTGSGVTFSGDADDANFPHENIATGKPWEMMRFASAGTDDYIHAHFSSGVSPDFTSIHFHNIDSGITAIQLRRGVTGGTLVSTLTKQSISFYGTFTGVSDQDWRLTFVGTNTGGPISMGEWWLGVKSTAGKPQKTEYIISHRMPQKRGGGKVGGALRHNQAAKPLRTLTLPFEVLTDTNLLEHVETMMEDCAWGEEPICIVPDSAQSWVVHGRPNPELVARRLDAGPAVGLWNDDIIIEEDPGPLIVK